MRTHICQQQRAPLIRLFPLLCMRSSFRWFNSPDTHVWVFYWFVAATEGMGIGVRACMFRCWLISFTEQINIFESHRMYVFSLSSPRKLVGAYLSLFIVKPTLNRMNIKCQYLDFKIKMHFPNIAFQYFLPKYCSAAINPLELDD